MYSGIPYGQYLDTPNCRVSIDNVRLKFSYKYKNYDFDKHEATTSIDLYSAYIDKLFPSLTTYANLQLGTDFAELPFPVKACLAHPDLIPMLKTSVHPNTWRSYKAMLTTYGSTALAPGNWQEVDRFVHMTLHKLKGGAA